MSWENIEQVLLKKIKITNKSLDPSGQSEYKIVKEVPNYFCKSYNEIGFRVQVGRDSYIDIPLSMLQTIYNHSKINGYNSAVFQNSFPKEYKKKPCYVHAIGQLFMKAGVMELDGKRKYKLLK